MDMSLLDEALAAPHWELPVVAEEDQPLAASFVQEAAKIAETLSRVGRRTITWSDQDGIWGLQLVDGTVRVASPSGDICTWIPGPEMAVRISADDKPAALERSHRALATLTAEE
jgi:hypothetical protein